jgi:hypothetical protein
MTSPYVTPIVQADHGPQATPATTETCTLGEVQFDALVSEVTSIPAGALAASDSAYRTFTLVNKGGDALANRVIATLVTNVAGGSWVAADEKKWVLSTNPVDLHVTANDVLVCQETVTGGGVAHPQMQITVKGERDQGGVV